MRYSLGNPCPLCGRAEPKHNHSTERCGLCPAHGCASCKLDEPPIVIPPWRSAASPRGIEADRRDYPHTHRTRRPTPAQIAEAQRMAQSVRPGRGGVFPIDWETSEPIVLGPD